MFSSSPNSSLGMPIGETIIKQSYCNSDIGQRSKIIREEKCNSKLYTSEPSKKRLY